MKKSFYFVLLLVMVSMGFNGCSTWHGVKKDAKRTWNVVTA